VARAIGRRLRDVGDEPTGLIDGPAVASKAAVLGATAALIAYGAQQLLLFPLSELDPMAWALAGALCASTVRASPARASAAGETASGESATPLDRGRWSRHLASAAISVAAVGALVIGVFDVAADHKAQSAIDALDDLRFGDARRAAGSATDWRPDTGRLHLLEARIVGAGQTDGSLRAAVAAVQRSYDIAPRDPIVNATLARARSALAARTRTSIDIATALAQWDHAIHRDPNNAQLLADRGRFAAEFGQAQTAVDFLTRAAELAPRDPVPLIDLARIAHDVGRTEDAVAYARRAEARRPDDLAVQALLVELGLVGDTIAEDGSG
jgi:tetratricopeptide (TPR) repeat protein